MYMYMYLLCTCKCIIMYMYMYLYYVYVYVYVYNVYIPAFFKLHLYCVLAIKTSHMVILYLTS